MPTLRVSLSLISSSGGNPVHLSSSSPVSVSSKEEYSLSISLERHPRLPYNGPARYAYTPRFHKPKTEGWFLTLGHIDSKELIALRRLPGPQSKINVQLTFTPPPTPGTFFLLFSDLSGKFYKSYHSFTLEVFSRVIWRTILFIIILLSNNSHWNTLNETIVCECYL